jgi:4-phytase/acid phosphatase
MNLQAIVKGTQKDEKIDVAPKGRSVEMAGPFATGSTFSENLLLEYTEGLKASALGWGRLTREKLERILEIHTVYADLTRRTRYLAQARSSNLLWHVLQSLEQAATGRQTEGAIDGAGGAALLLAGHDTNLSNLSGMLNLSWKLPDYQADDAPPGGALIFELWRDGAEYRLRLRFVSQSMDQMRSEQAGLPESTDVALPGCETGACEWDTARRVIAKAIDLNFVDKSSR